MSTMLKDLLNDVLIAKDAVAKLQSEQKITETRLVEALAGLGYPLNAKNPVVIGGWLLKKPYEYLPIEVSEISNAKPESVVIE